MEDVPTLELTDQTDTGATVRWGSIERALRYDVEVDGSVVSGDDGQYATSYALSFTRPDTVRVRVRGRNQVGPGNWVEKRYTFAEKLPTKRDSEGSVTSPRIYTTKKLIKENGVVGSQIRLAWDDYDATVVDSWEYQYDFSQSFIRPQSVGSIPRATRDNTKFVAHTGSRIPLYARIRSVLTDGGPSPWSDILNTYLGLQYSDLNMNTIIRGTSFVIDQTLGAIPPQAPSSLSEFEALDDYSDTNNRVMVVSIRKLEEALGMTHRTIYNTFAFGRYYASSNPADSYGRRTVYDTWQYAGHGSITADTEYALVYSRIGRSSDRLSSTRTDLGFFILRDLRYSQYSDTSYNILIPK